MNPQCGPYMGPFKYDGKFVCQWEWSPATSHIREQSCLKAHGTNAGTTLRNKDLQNPTVGTSLSL